ncbi:MAG: hypothetical protein QOF42_728 [Gammaproteobacteria bacterium]|jgi:hypothetical protein|nr:hypothetical protein [Gammaproteobacteria bacterium]
MTWQAARTTPPVSALKESASEIAKMKPREAIEAAELA